MAEKTLGQAYVQIVPSARGIKGSIENAISPEASSAGKKAGGKLAGALKGAIGAAAIGAALKKAITEGADLEQSIGGIKTLFGDAADGMIDKANNAFKTAGLSANDYMETVTSFSASLLQSLGGDTKKAAAAADKAITAMSDNANKMGTDMESIQNAYQGFAKQNYTMLDNLKLGYGGTKEEMERLLEDAEKLTGQKYDISNLADVYKAIEVIQDDLDITGTTSKEAATTLSGSFASMKAAGQNFLGQLTIGGNVGEALTNFINSACTFLFDNLVPALGNIIKALPGVVINFVSTGIPNLLTKMNTIMSSFLDSIGTKTTAKMTGSTLKKIVTALKNIVSALGTTLVNLIPKLAGAAGRLISGVATGLISTGKTAIGNAIDKIKGWFNFNLKFPSIKLPHIRVGLAPITGSGVLVDLAKKMGLNNTLKFSVDWYKTGGIFNEPSIIGVGEAGSEAVVPLDKLWEKLDGMNTAVINFNGNYSFRNRDDLDYFLRESGKMIRQEVAFG